MAYNRRQAYKARRRERYSEALAVAILALKDLKEGKRQPYVRWAFQFLQAFASTKLVGLDKVMLHMFLIDHEVYL